ncbi:hypothetical protein M8J75_008610 [Diaphorina citri]|nr:hypothetical protein M8J75_008610 [Diaphorina citri]
MDYGTSFVILANVPDSFQKFRLNKASIQIKNQVIENGENFIGTEMLTVFGSVKPYRHRLDFSEFQCIVTHKMRSLPMEYNIALLFNLIDEEDKHFITLADLLKVFGQHFPAVSQQILKEIFTHLDSNHTGRLHFSKFCAFLKK